MGKSWDQYRLGEPHEAPRRKGLKTFAIVTALMAIMILPAMAAKGGNGGKGHSTGGSTSGDTIALKLLNGDTQPLFGHQVSFNITATFSQPYVNLNCYQGGTWVSGEWGGFYEGSAYDQIFTLGPSNSWSGGDADCTADLVEWTARGALVVKASTSFHVN
jgi:hypothetical protein